MDDKCEMNIEDCNPNLCNNEGTCVNNYTCMCTEDFKGRNCTIYIGKCPDNYMTGKLSYVHIYAYNYKCLMCHNSQDQQLRMYN